MKNIFFYCPPISSSESYIYPHSIVCLAEGLKELGVNFYSNVNYWKTSYDQEEYLFNADPEIAPDNCDVVVLDSDWFVDNIDFPKGLFKSDRNYLTVYFERSANALNLPQNAWKPEFRQFDYIFRTHYNRRFIYPKNVLPWAMGLSNRVLKELDNPLKFSEKQKRLLVNFRLGHPLRKEMQERFIPLIQDSFITDDTVDEFDTSLINSYHHLQWLQTGMRHYPSYYQRLTDSAACACFGGLFINPWPPGAFGPTQWWDKALNKILIKVDPRPRRLMNWDSFRFWESLAAGCITFHADLEKYGAVLPVMPVNLHNYVGIDLENMDEAVARLRSEPKCYDEISNQGRQWALEHYSPSPTALRFLETVFSNTENFSKP